MNELTEQFYRDYVVTAENHTKYPINTSAVMKDTGEILYHIVKKYKPEKSLEIGLAYGLSALHICQALYENGCGSHTAIDPYEETDYQSVGLLNLEKAGFEDMLTFDRRPSYQALADMDAKGCRFDFAFIDGSHLFDYALVDFFLIDRMLKKKGIVVFDDLWMPSIRKVVMYVLRNRSYKWIKPGRMVKTPFLLKTLRVSRRIMQGLPGKDFRLRCIPQNVIILEKTTPDNREWDFHNNF